MEITIITPCFNAEDTIIDCVQSVDQQSAAVKHLIIDGGSTDRTLSIIADYICNNECNIDLISEADNGIYDAMNKGILRSNTEIVGVLNADDLYEDNNVLARVVHLFKDENVMTAYADLNYVSFDDTTRIVRKWKSGQYNPKNFYYGWMPPHPTFFVRKSLYDKYGVFDESMGTAADYELILRFLLKHRIDAVYIPEVLVNMRAGGVSNASIANRIKANLMDRRAWRVNNLKPYPWTLFIKPLRKVGQWFYRS